MSAGPAGSAGVADGGRTLLSWGTLPAGVTAVQLGACQDPFGVPATPAPESSQRIFTARGDAPYGDDAFEISSATRAGLAFDVPGLDHLATLVVSTLGGHSGGGPSYTRAAVDLTVAGHRWRLTSYLQQPKLGWQRHDLNYFAWDDLDAADEPVESGTAAEFIAAHGDATAQVRLAVTGCDDEAQVDGLTWGPVGASDTHDVESAKTVALIGAESYQGRTTVGCSLLSHDVLTGTEVVSGRPFVLLARPYGSAYFTEAERGGGAYPVRPVVTTEYRCRFDGDAPDPDGPEHAPATSPTARVAAPHVVTMAAAVRGRKVVVTGSTTPVHPGTGLVLRARRPGVPAVRVTGVVRGNGRYRIVVRLGPGSWRVVVTEAAAAGNTRGRSAVRTVATSRAS